jgi:hypothetical protein
MTNAPTFQAVEVLLQQARGFAATAEDTYDVDDLLDAIDAALLKVATVEPRDLEAEALADRADRWIDEAKERASEN